jgi:hypothetical protein
MPQRYFECSRRSLQTLVQWCENPISSTRIYYYINFPLYIKTFLKGGLVDHHQSLQQQLWTLVAVANIKRFVSGYGCSRIPLHLRVGHQQVAVSQALHLRLNAGGCPASPCQGPACSSDSNEQNSRHYSV